MADQSLADRKPAGAAPSGMSRGRWYILLLISVMYLITYLDRVNISTAAPVRSARNSASTKSPWA